MNMQTLNLATIRQHFTRSILASLARMTRGSDVTIDQRQCNSMDGVWQARVRLTGDDRTYRLLLAPEEAPITLYGRPIDAAFSLPLDGTDVRDGERVA